MSAATRADESATPGLRPRPPRAWALLAGSGACAALVAVLAIGAWTPALPAVPIWLQTHAPVVIDAAMVWHVLGKSTVLTPIAVAVVILLLVFGRRGAAAYVAVCGLLGVLCVEALKRSLDRPRPEYAVLVESGGSFPSGHAAAGIYVWVVFGIAAWAVLPGRWRLVALPLWVFGALMGPSRVALGVHYWTDVLGGWALGAAVVLLVSAAVLLIRRVRDVPR